MEFDQGMIIDATKGNVTRFVNHSCQPNSQFERFVWVGAQRIVLVSKSIEAGEEITVDYSDNYWKASRTGNLWIWIFMLMTLES